MARKLKALKPKNAVKRLIWKMDKSYSKTSTVKKDSIGIMFP